MWLQDDLFWGSPGLIQQETVMMMRVHFLGIAWIPRIPRIERREGNEGKSISVAMTSNQVLKWYADKNDGSCRLIIVSRHVQFTSAWLNLQFPFCLFFSGLKWKVWPKRTKRTNGTVSLVVIHSLSQSMNNVLLRGCFAHDASRLCPSGPQRAERTKGLNWEIRGKGLSHRYLFIFTSL